MYTVILLWHVSGCGPLSLNEIKDRIRKRLTKVCTAVCISHVSIKILIQRIDSNIYLAECTVTTVYLISDLLRTAQVND